MIQNVPRSWGRKRKHLRLANVQTRAASIQNSSRKCSNSSRKCPNSSRKCSNSSRKCSKLEPQVFKHYILQSLRTGLLPHSCTHVYSVMQSCSVPATLDRSSGGLEKFTETPSGLVHKTSMTVHHPNPPFPLRFWTVLWWTIHLRDLKNIFSDLHFEFDFFLTKFIDSQRVRDHATHKSWETQWGFHV